MPRSVPIPDVMYQQTETPDTDSIDAVFDKIFELVLKDKSEE